MWPLKPGWIYSRKCCRTNERISAITLSRGRHFLDAVSGLQYSLLMGRKQKNFEHAVSLYNSGFSLEEVAVHYGITRQAMHEALKRRGVVFRPQKRFGKDNHFYRGGGRKKTDGGYIKVLINGRWRFEHRVVMECKLGRALTSDEVVHHINEVKDDNRPDNLEIMTPAAHNKHHHKERRERRLGRSNE